MAVNATTATTATTANTTSKTICDMRYGSHGSQAIAIEC